MKALQETARVIRNERITERLWWCTYESPGIAATARAEKIGLTDIAVSLSHSREFAVASVVGESERGNLVPRR